VHSPMRPRSNKLKSPRGLKIILSQASSIKTETAVAGSEPVEPAPIFGSRQGLRETRRKAKFKDESSRLKVQNARRYTNRCCAQRRCRAGPSTALGTGGRRDTNQFHGGVGEMRAARNGCATKSPTWLSAKPCSSRVPVPPARDAPIANDRTFLCS
jgi:hypothetical protein